MLIISAGNIPTVSTKGHTMNIVKNIKAAIAAKKALRRRKFKMFQAEDRFEWPRATK